MPLLRHRETASTALHRAVPCAAPTTVLSSSPFTAGALADQQAVDPTSASSDIQTHQSAVKERL